MDREERLQRLRVGGLAFTVAGIVVLASAGYAVSATILWYPSHWPLTVFLIVFGAAVLGFGVLARHWSRPPRA